MIDSNNTPTCVQIKSIHKKQISSQFISNNELGGIFLKGLIHHPQKNVIISSSHLKSYAKVYIDATSVQYDNNAKVTVYTNNQLVSGSIVHAPSQQSRYVIILSKPVVHVPLYIGTWGIIRTDRDNRIAVAKLIYEDD